MELSDESSRRESQAHGFIWEAEVLTKVYKLSEAESYTAKHDLPAAKNTLDHVDVSIKTSKGKSVDMGDVVRFYSSIADLPNNRFLNLTVLFYDQVGDQKELREMVEVKLERRDLAILFGSLTLEEIQGYVAWVRAIPAGKDAQSAANEELHGRKDDINSRSGVVKLRPKVDSKNQRRVQCSFPDLMGFAEKHLPARLSKHKRRGDTLYVQKAGMTEPAYLRVRIQSSPRKRGTHAKDKKARSLTTPKKPSANESDGKPLSNLIDEGRPDWSKLRKVDLERILRAAKKVNKAVLVSASKKEMLISRVEELDKEGKLGGLDE